MVSAAAVVCFRRGRTEGPRWVTTVMGTLFAVGRGCRKGMAALATLLDAGRGGGGGEGALRGVVSWVVLAAMGALLCVSRGEGGGVDGGYPRGRLPGREGGGEDVADHGQRTSLVDVFFFVVAPRHPVAARDTRAVLAAPLLRQSVL